MLHILQGGIENGDKRWLERAARLNLSSRLIAPKSVQVGDEAVIYIAGYGFFATARIKSAPKPRSDWPGRFGAAITSVKLISPPISLPVILRGVPELKWAKYQRSIHTPSSRLVGQIEKLIATRRKTGITDLKDDDLTGANIEEMRQLAYLSARRFGKKMNWSATYRARSLRIHAYVLRRARGHCEGCKTRAPFLKPGRTPYLEPHHTARLADDGPDHPATIIALCPNCHRRAHYGEDAKIFNRSLIDRLAKIEPERRIRK